MRERGGEQEIYLSDIIAALKRRRPFIVCCIAASLAAGLMYAVFATPRYTASVTIAPVLEEGGTLSGVAGSLGGVAALTGIDLGGGGSERAEFLAILRSRQLGGQFIEKYELKPHLFPGEWNEQSGNWNEDGPGIFRRVFDAGAHVLARFSGDEGWAKSDAIPSDREAFRKFEEEILVIEEDVQSGLVTVSIEFREPQLAARWANSYVSMANEEIRRDAVAEAARALDYLNAEVGETTVAGIRETIFNLIENQLEKITIANARPEYAFKILDPAVIPEEHSHPRRLLIILLSIFAGVILGVGVALAAETRRRAFDPPSV